MATTPHITEDFVSYALHQMNQKEGWKLEMQNEVVALFVHPAVALHSSGHARGIKVVGKVSIPFSWLFRVMKETEHRSTWDASNTEVNKRSVVNDEEELIYNVMKSPNRFLFSNREIVSARRTIKEKNPTTNKPVVYFVAKSVEAEQFPVAKGNVRGKLHVQVIRAEEVSETECEVQFFSCMDFGNVPSFILGMISKRIAENLTQGLYKGYDYIQSISSSSSDSAMK